MIDVIKNIFDNTMRKFEETEEGRRFYSIELDELESRFCKSLTPDQQKMYFDMETLMGKNALDEDSAMFEEGFRTGFYLAFQLLFEGWSAN